MIKILGVVFSAIVTSFYFFPFNPTFLPTGNSKMVVAAFGLFVLILNMAKNSGRNTQNHIISLSVYAGIISVLSFMTALVHNTNDYSYSSFIMSYFVWTGAAYACIQLIKYVHGYISIRLMCNYLILVCLSQCILALCMNYFPQLKFTVDNLIEGEGFMGKAEGGRLYGIGCALDVAGGRFAAVLCMIAFLCINSNEYEEKNHTIWYLTAFSIIVVIGSMIGRSTILGVIVALVYWIYATGVYQKITNSGGKELLLWFIFILSITIPIIIYFYKSNPTFHANLRFGFEGFFSWWEKGRWETNSNNILENMVVFPDNLSTWLFGDGYIANPREIDPYYVGKDYHGFYMSTDIGYLRFIFYFGVIGMIAMVAYICKSALTCIKTHPKYKTMFIMILVLNLIYWGKVSTDLYLVFAPFLLISNEENESYLNRYHEDKCISPNLNEDIKWES